jgi:SAM-dependent methyltransferase
MTALPAEREFFERLRPTAESEPPAFATGWPRGDRTDPYLSYLQPNASINWSDELESIHEEERDHFIDELTRRAVMDALAVERLAAGSVVADVGCASGRLLADLAARLPDGLVVGLDALGSALAAAHARLPDVPLFHASATELPFGDETVDVVTALNVLEHLEDDMLALVEFRRVLRPGGRAAIVVPANPGLYDHYDSFLQHERRYARGVVAAKAREAGLRPLRTEFVGSLVYPGFWAVKTYGRIRHSTFSPAEARELTMGRIRGTRDLPIGRFAARLERRLVRAGIRLPFGIRELAIVGKAG